MLKPKSKKGEIGTIVMMALLVIVSLISFGSPNFLSKKQTISTKAATTCVIGGKCGSGKQWNCTTDNGCDPTGSCKIQDLEFACCVLNYKACSDGITNKYRWYGCTGQPCQNQTISQSNGPGYLVGCQSGVGPGNPDSCQIQLPTPTPTPSTPNTDNPASSSETCDDYGSANVCSGNCDTYCKAGKISNSKKWCCSGGQTTNTPTPTRTPTPTIVNTPLPTSSGKICAIFTLDYKCYGIGKIFHPSQIVSVCPKNSSCWGIDTSSCDQTFEEVQKYFCSDQPPTPTGPTATTNPNSPSKTPTPTTPLLGDDCGNNYGCNDIFSTTCDDNGKQLPCGSCNRSLADNLTYRCIGAYCNPNYRNAGHSTNLREDCTPVEGENLNCKDTNNFSSRTCQFYCSNKISNYPNKNYYFSTKDTKYYRDNCSLLGESNTEELSENLQSYCACTSIPVGADNVIQSEDGTQYWNCKLAGTSSNKDSATSTCASCQALFGWPNKRQCVITKNSGSSYNTYCCEGGGI